MSIWTIRLKADLTDIATEVLDNISDGPVLDLAMGGGQFVSLAEQRQSPDSVFGCEELNSDIKYAKKTKNLKGNYKTSKPTEVMELMTNIDISKMNIVGNWPFTSGAGRAPVPVDIARNLKKYGYPKTLSIILQSGFLHSTDGGLSELRQYLFDAGLYKIKFNKKDLFKDSGATVPTVTVFCKAGYTGLITVINNKTSYDFDYRKYGLIVDGGTKSVTDFLYSLFNKTKTYGCLLNKQSKSVKLDKIPKDKISDKSKEGYEKTITQMSKSGNTVQYIEKGFLDTNYNEKVVFGYLPSGLSHSLSIGLVSSVDSSTQVLNGPYRFFEAKNRQHRISLENYITSDVIDKFILPSTRINRTFDAKTSSGVTKFIPALPDNVKIKNNDDVFNFLEAPQEVRDYINENYIY